MGMKLKVDWRILIELAVIVNIGSGFYVMFLVVLLVAVVTQIRFYSNIFKPPFYNNFTGIYIFEIVVETWQLTIIV